MLTPLACQRPAARPLLRGPHTAVRAALRQQSGVPAPFDHLPLVNDQNLVGGGDRRQAVGDDDQRAVFDQRVDGLSNSMTMR